MFHYWLVWSVFAAGALARYRHPNLHRITAPLIIAVLCLIVFVGMRWRVGADWHSYTYIFQHAKPMNFGTAINEADPGFYALIWLTHYLGLKIWALNLLCAAILGLGLLVFAQRQPNPWLAILVAVPYLVIVIGMSATRQATAIGFVLIGLSQLGRGSLVKVFLWIICGALFHASALLVAVLVGAAYSKNRWQALALLGVAVVPAYYVTFSTFDEYVQRYTTKDIDSAGVWVRIAMNFVPALILLLFRRHFGITTVEAPIWKYMAIAAIFMLPAGFLVESTTALDRFSLYATPLQLLILSRVPVAFSRTDVGRAFWTAAVIVYSAITLAVYLLLASHAEYYIPYRFAL